MALPVLARIFEVFELFLSSFMLFNIGLLKMLHAILRCLSFSILALGF
jgi:hypothetical protein